MHSLTFTQYSPFSDKNMHTCELKHLVFVHKHKPLLPEYQLSKNNKANCLCFVNSLRAKVYNLKITKNKKITFYILYVANNNQGGFFVKHLTGTASYNIYNGIPPKI